MKKNLKSYLFLSLALLLVVGAGTTQAVPLGANTQIGIDLGPTPTTNWNNFNSNTTIGAGSVVDLTGTVVDGVSITTANGRFYNNDGTNNWNGLSTNGGSAPSEFVDSVVTDISGSFGGAQFTYDVTIDGLNPNLFYDITAVTAAVFQRMDTVTAFGAMTSAPSTISRPDAVSMGIFHTFDRFAPTAAGTISFQVTDPQAGNPILNGILINVSVPEPSTAMLGIVALAGLARRRRTSVPAVV